MTDRTPRFGWPLLRSGQGQKEVTHNEALVSIDAMTSPAVESAVQAAPATTGSGRLWIVPAGASGAWSGRDWMIAQDAPGGWRFHAPVDGQMAWLKDRSAPTRFAGGTWTVLPPMASPRPVQEPAGGALVDIEARMALGKMLEVLRAHGLVT